jgi:hypothetical protein
MELKIQVPDRMAIGGDTSTRIGTSGNSKELDDNDALWTLRRIAGAMPKAHYMQFTQTFFLEPIFLLAKSAVVVTSITVSLSTFGSMCQSVNIYWKE